MTEFKGVLAATEAQDIDPRLSGKHIDGLAVVEHKGNNHYFPFRSKEKGGKTEDTPHIWEWKNPEESTDNLTLTPSIVEKEGGYTGSNEELFHVFIENGELVHA